MREPFLIIAYGSSVDENMRNEARGIARDPRGVFADADARGLVADHPAADDRKVAVELREEMQLLDHMAFCAISARPFFQQNSMTIKRDIRALA